MKNNGVSPESSPVSCLRRSLGVSCKNVFKNGDSIGESLSKIWAEIINHHGLSLEHNKNEEARENKEELKE